MSVLGRGKLRLLLFDFEAALFIIAGCFVPVLIAVHAGWGAALTGLGELLISAGMILVPCGLTAWWQFRKLQSYYTRDEALKAAKAFAVTGPVALAVSVPLAQIPGGYGALVLGSRYGGLAGAIVGIVVMVTFVNFVSSTVAIRMSHWP